MTLKYLAELAELKNDLASYKDMGTDIEVSFSAPQLLVCTH